MEASTFSFEEYFSSVVGQDADAMRCFFTENAEVFWHNTREHFTRDEFIRANCEYPNEWRGEIEREYRIGSTLIAAARVFSKTDPQLSFHCCSFITLSGEMIARLDEYWGDDGAPPEWRKALRVGRRF